MCFEGKFYLFIFLHLKIAFIVVSRLVCGHMCVMRCMQKSDDNFQESVPSIHHRSQGLNSGQQAPLPSESSLWPSREREFKCLTQTSAHVCLAKPNTLGQRICQNPFLNFCSSMIIFNVYLICKPHDKAN